MTTINEIILNDVKHFKEIKSGIKTVYGTLNKGEWLSVKPDTKYKISGIDGTFMVKVTSIIKLPKFIDLYNMYGTDLLPSGSGTTPWDIYHDWYSKYEEEKMGVIGVTLEII